MSEEKKSAVIENKVYFNKKKGMGEIIEQFKKAGATFDFTYTAGKGYVLTNKNIAYDLYSAGGGNGMHLCNLAIHDLEKRLESGEYKKVYENDVIPETVLFNTPVIQRSIEDNLQCVAIDINNCYWEAAHNLGIIGDKLHKQGYNKVEAYKKGRRAAIGSFNAEKVTERYVNGKKVWETPLSERHRPYNFARVHIISHVFDMAVDICSIIPDALVMFLTDCFFVHPDYEQYIFDELKKRGYSAKKKPIWFTGLENGYRSTKIVKWDCQETLKVKATDIKNYAPHLHYYNIKNELITALTVRNKLT